jgi:hypothetical protein
MSIPSVDGDAYELRLSITDATRRMFMNLARGGGAITGGQIVTTSNGAFAGSTYCVGPGSSEMGNEPRIVTLTGLSKVASCAGSTGGSVNGCWAQ